MKFFFHLQEQTKYWKFVPFFVAEHQLNNQDFQSAWTSSSFVVFIVLQNCNRTFQCSGKKVYAFNNYDYNFPTNCTQLPKDPDQAISQIIHKWKEDPNPTKPSVVCCHVEDLDTDFIQASGEFANVKFLKCPVTKDKNFEAELDVCKWRQRQIVVPVVTKDCLENESFKWLISKALIERKSIVLLHTLGHPFPKTEEVPKEIRSIFDYVAVKLLPTQSKPCWKKILKRAHRGEENLETDLFLSHRQATGQGIALALYHKLRKHSKKPFLDIKAQFNLHDLKMIVRETKLFVFILTEGIFESEWCYQEFQAAVAHQVNIVILRDSGFQLPTEHQVPPRWLPYLLQILETKKKVMLYDAAYLNNCVNDLITNWKEHSFKITLVAEPRTPVVPHKEKKLLVAVGGEKTSTAESYTNGKWEALPDMNESRDWCGVVSVGGCVYAVGGDGDNGKLSTAEKYDPVRKNWVPIASMNIPRSCFGLATLNDKIYALGGVTKDGLTDTIEEYDTTTNTWSKLSLKLERPMYWFGIAASEDAIYVVGGHDDKGRLASVLKITPSANRVQALGTQLETARNSLSAICSNQKLYAIGGWQDGPNSAVKDILVLDLSTKAWSKLPPMSVPRIHAGAAILDGNLVVGGGFAKGTPVTSVECFASGKWTTLAELTMPRKNLVLLQS